MVRKSPVTRWKISKTAARCNGREAGKVDSNAGEATEEALPPKYSAPTWSLQQQDHPSIAGKKLKSVLKSNS